MNFDELKPLIQPILVGWARHFLGAAGGAVGMTGLNNNDNVQLVVGFIMLVGAFATSALQKYINRSQAQPPAPPVEAK